MTQLKSVLITGASTGIGRACALWMDRMGWEVFAGVRREADGAALREAGTERLQPILLDVTDGEQVAQAGEWITRTVGQRGLHGLVNNAGVAVGGLMEFTRPADLRWQLEINVVAQLAVTQEMLPLLRQARGCIVNMSSIAGKSATPGLGAYAASKHGLEAISDALRLELHPWRIRVVLVEPGEIATPIWAKSLAAVQEMMEAYPPEAHRLYGPLIEKAIGSTQRRAAQNAGLPPEAVAEVVGHALMTARPKARYVVGQDARLRLWIERLPDRLRDRIIRSRMPRYGED